MQILSYNANYITRQVTVTILKNSAVRSSVLEMVTTTDVEGEEVTSGVVPEVFTVDNLQQLIEEQE